MHRFNRPTATLLRSAAVAAAFATITGGAPIAKAVAAPAAKTQETVVGLIVKPRPNTGRVLAAAIASNNVQALSQIAGVQLSAFRPMSNGAHVLHFGHRMALSEARAVAARLVRSGAVEYAEPDRILHTFGLTPTDSFYAMQWHYMAPDATNKGGANLPDAWSVTTGKSTVTVAVVDNGIRPHADLGPLLAGYDFVSDSFTANDGNGRDADPADPGDSAVANECYSGSPVTDSTWHGTHVAGTIFAQMNGTGVVGIAPGVHLLPVRVLGKCGGFESDVIDGMRWAAGLSVPSAPVNANPAGILNLSLGVSGTCSAAMQSAVTDIVNAGKTVIVAAGNYSAVGSTAPVAAPANCTGAIAVAAHAIDGDIADYSSVGPEIALSAPGGGCGYAVSSASGCGNFGPGSNDPGVLSTFNAGAAGPGADAYAYDVGTSMATPHVTGVAALMLSVKSLTPAELKSYLKSSARGFPAGVTCLTDANYQNKCGVGLLDGAAAVQAAVNAIIAPPPVVTAVAGSQVVAPSTTVSLEGSALAGNGRSIVSYSWAQLTGAPVAISGAGTSHATFSAPATGTYAFRLTATDNGGQSGSADVIVRVKSAPVLQPVPAQSVTVGNTLSFTVAATDADGDTPIFSADSLPQGATLSAGGVFNWPNAAPVGNYTMTYYANDNDASSAQGTVTIHVNAASSGGGGSLDGEWLLGLAFLALCLRVRRAVK